MNILTEGDLENITTPFGVDQIADNTKTDFDLFLSVRDHVILYSGAGYHWFKAEVENLLGNGIDSLQIRERDRKKMTMYLQVIRLPHINKNQPPTQRIKTIQDIAASFTEMIFEGDLTASCVDKAKEIAEAMVGCIKENAKCIQAIGELSDHDHYTYRHSVRVATLATAIAFQMGLTADEPLRDIALGCLLHDIGKAKVPLDVINKVGALTAPEWEQMRAHPETGFSKVKNFILSHVPREIILHHHEKRDGSGYPHQLLANGLLDEVQIATLADVYDALTSSRSYQKARSRFEALEFIKQKMVGPKLSAEAFRSLVSALA